MGRKHREGKPNAIPAVGKDPSGRINQKLKAAPDYGKVLGKLDPGPTAAGVQVLQAEKSCGRKLQQRNEPERVDRLNMQCYCRRVHP